jgi:hypothetical protein
LRLTRPMHLPRGQIPIASKIMAIPCLRHHGLSTSSRLRPFKESVKKGERSLISFRQRVQGRHDFALALIRGFD